MGTGLELSCLDAGDTPYRPSSCTFGTLRSVPFVQVLRKHYRNITILLHLQEGIEIVMLTW